MTRLRLRDKYIGVSPVGQFPTFAHEMKKDEVGIKFQNKKDEDAEQNHRD